MTVSYLRVRWLTVLTILGIAVVLSACSDSSAPTPEPTATTPVPTGTVGSTPTSAQSPINAFASVSAGFFHTCGVRADGSVECWGSDSDGQSSITTTVEMIG